MGWTTVETLLDEFFDLAVRALGMYLDALAGISNPSDQS
jgi:hypothetical protein